jgi:hypothetical protein
VKADSKDYSMSFKLQIVQEIERGQLVTESTDLVFKIDQLLLNGLENSVTLIGKTKPITMSKSPEQKIMDLNQSKTSRETEVFWNDRPVADKKAIILI